jgi:hypothetical protein
VGVPLVVVASCVILDQLWTRPVVGQRLACALTGDVQPIGQLARDIGPRAEPADQRSGGQLAAHRGHADQAMHHLWWWWRAA